MADSLFLLINQRHRNWQRKQKDENGQTIKYAWKIYYFFLFVPRWCSFHPSLNLTKKLSFFCDFFKNKKNSSPFMNYFVASNVVDWCDSGTAVRLSLCSCGSVNDLQFECWLLSYIFLLIYPSLSSSSFVDLFFLNFYVSIFSAIQLSACQIVSLLSL